MSGISPGLAGQINNNIQTDGLVLYLDAAYKKSYPRTGTTWYDLSGYGNNATISGPTYNSAGYFDFDGTNDYMTVAHSTSIAMTTSLSIYYVLWLEDTHADGTSGYGIATKTNSSWGVGVSPGWYIYVGGVPSMYPQWVFGPANFGGSEEGNSYIASALVEATWNQYSISYNSSANTVRKYVNGGVSGTDVTGVGSMGSHTDSMRIGYINAQQKYLDGRIAIMLMYNRALSDAEVKQNYDAQKERFGF